MNKKQFDDYSRVASACNSLDREIADLMAYVNLLKRVGNVDAIDDLRLRIYNFLSEVQSNYKATLPDE